MTEVYDYIERVPGFQVAGVHCGLKADGVLDFALISSATPCTVSGVFTTNAVKAAPVRLTMERLKSHGDRVRAIAINTGSANALTGGRGIIDAASTAQLTADALGVDRAQVLTLSTGVIGIPLPMDRIADGIDRATAALGDNWHGAAQAIMTTDTRPKTCAIVVHQPNGRSYTVAGIAKGAGMIAPNMATMLAVIVTDARLVAGQADEALRVAVRHTFNRIVVDGDMSTNDAVLLLANGAGDVSIDTGIDLIQFEMALIQVCRRLAHSIVQDGEGATKFITINVDGAPDDGAAHAIASAIARSPLVKTAFYGEDPNWGRILAAAGQTGVRFEPEKAQLFIASGQDAHDTQDELLLMSYGEAADYDEEAAKAIMRSDAVTVSLELNQGTGWSTVWTTDFSPEYVQINAAYRS